MPLPLRKRRRPSPAPGITDGSREAVRFPEVVIFLVEKRMGSSRRAFLGKLARTKGFLVEEAYSDAVTHVVSEHNTRAEVCAWLETQSGHREGLTPALLDVSWFTESMGDGTPVEIEPRHRLEADPFAGAQEDEGLAVPAYACQRRTPLPNPNQVFTDALETLAKEAALGGSEGRSLAFTRAASVLRSLPYTLTRLEELVRLPSFGAHSRKVIQELLEDGSSGEVQQVLQSERFRTLKLFTGIFGVGQKTANRWYQEGLRNLEDLKKEKKKLNREQEAGLLHFTDLNSPVSRAEADEIQRIVQDAVLRFLPGAIITLTGGFRRGKQSGHDVDFLITHPEDGAEAGLLVKAVSWLGTQGLILYKQMRQNSYQEDMGAVPHGGKGPPAGGSMDHFERCFSIFRLGSPGDPRGWKAVRVDLVVAPFVQYPFALLGWTGSKHFERELRRFAVYERKMILNSHALYNSTQKAMLPARSEEEIFAHLGLEYVPPSERNA